MDLFKEVTDLGGNPRWAYSCGFLDNRFIDCIIEALANPMKERLKHEDTTVSQWLQGENSR